MRYKITLLLLPPHSSHYTQPLDVAVFGPLSVALGREVDRFVFVGISRLSEAEWLQLYIKARERSFTTKNTFSAWRGAELMPLSRTKVLRHLPIPTSPSTTPSRSHPILQAITSSPPDSTTLRTSNA